VRLRPTLTCALAWLLPMAAAAQSTSADKALATQLYDDADAAMKAGNYGTACPKYHESYRLDPQLGILLHLADCHEKMGKLASAWAEFKEAIEFAERKKAGGQAETRDQLARTRATALEPKLARMTVKVTDEIQGLEVLRGEAPVSRAIWGSAVPIDPGTYTITAKAPGKKTWTQSVKVEALGARIEVVVPKLEPEPVAATPPPEKPAAPVPTPVATPVPPPAKSAQADLGVTPPASSPQKTIGFVVGGVGVVGLAVGAVFFLKRNSALSDRDAICPTGFCSPSEGEQIRALESDAKSATTLGLVVGGLGGAALVGGIVLIATAPSNRPSAMVTPWMNAGAGGAVVTGRW
jgi:hypothetical protein